jgi:hypothetical protein
MLREEGFRAFFKGSFLVVTYVAFLFGFTQMVYQFGVSQRLTQMATHYSISKTDEPIMDHSS